MILRRFYDPARRGTR